MKSYNKWMLAIILVIATGAILLAQGPNMMRQGRRWPGQHMGLIQMLHNPDLRTRFGITEDQAAKLDAAFLNAAKTSIKDRADLKIRHLELANLMSADKVDRALVDQKIDEISALQTSLMKNRIETQLTLKETLTPDQFNKLREWRRNQGRRMGGEWMQMHRGMMRGPNGQGMGPRGPQSQQPPQPPAPPKPGDDSSQ